jgi:ABC-type multidrug transport system fused ATPase/permease subunit
MRAALRPATIRHLEEPALHDKVEQSHKQGMMGPSGAPTRLATWASDRLRGAVALLVVGHFSVWLALLLAVVWLHHLRRMRGAHRELITVRWRQTPETRYGQYLGGLPLSADVAKEVRVFGLRAWLADRFERAWTAAMADLRARRRDLAPQMALAVLPVVVVEALALALMGRSAVAGEIGVGALIVYANAVLDSHWFGGASDSDLAVQYATAGPKSLAELERLVETEPTLALPGTRPADGLPREAIGFGGVSRSYPGQPAPVLRNLDLEIPAGRSLAIVGTNWGGKTTLVKLLCRLYDPSPPLGSASPGSGLGLWARSGNLERDLISVYSSG